MYPVEVKITIKRLIDNASFDCDFFFKWDLTISSFICVMIINKDIYSSLILSHLDNKFLCNFDKVSNCNIFL